jgi:CIC family chloride channel protein
MERECKLLIDSAQGRRNPLLLAILSVIVGAISGLLGAAFRLALQRADELRNSLAQWAHGYGAAGFFLVLSGTALAVGLAAWLVARFSPESSGSGIPHVETELKKRWSGDPARIAPVKFVGGILAIGSGLALRREGPTVHIGASLGHLLAKIFRCNEHDARVLWQPAPGQAWQLHFTLPSLARYSFSRN